MNKIEIRSINGSNPFTPVADADGVSLTANASGFTPISAVVSAYEWSNTRKVSEASDACNNRGEICIIPDLRPTAFLVPRTHGRMHDQFLIKDLMDAVEHMRIRKLHFAHFFFILEKLPLNELTLILEHLRNRSTGAPEPKIVFDIDSRHELALRQLFDQIVGIQE
jgi:hypothetical protein